MRGELGNDEFLPDLCFPLCPVHSLDAISVININIITHYHLKAIKIISPYSLSADNLKDGRMGWPRTKAVFVIAKPAEIVPSCLSKLSSDNS